MSQEDVMNTCYELAVAAVTGDYRTMRGTHVNSMQVAIEESKSRFSIEDTFRPIGGSVTYDNYIAIMNEMLRDGPCHWGRISMAYAVATLVETPHGSTRKELGAKIGTFLASKLSHWIQSSGGGWDKFDEFWSRSTEGSGGDQAHQLVAPVRTEEEDRAAMRRATRRVIAYSVLGLGAIALMIHGRVPS